MLRQTFCHLEGVGPKTEQRIWNLGIRSWDDLVGVEDGALPFKRAGRLREGVAESTRHLENKDVQFFSDSLPVGEQWRLFPELRHSTCYLDIETTGLVGGHITTIATYDGTEVRHYVYDQNLYDFKDDICQYDLLVTYNGKCFDVPFLRDFFFGINLDQAHIDLRFPLRRIGYRGGLKSCEKQLGLCRGDLDEIDGFFAVCLWDEFRKTERTEALETLLAYNIQDVLTLETLMVAAYNRLLEQTPFAGELSLTEPEMGKNPFQPDAETVDRIRSRLTGYMW